MFHGPGEVTEKVGLHVSHFYYEENYCVPHFALELNLFLVSWRDPDPCGNF